MQKKFKLYIAPYHQFTTTTICKCIRTSGVFTHAQSLGQISRPPTQEEFDNRETLYYYYEPQHLYVISDDEIKFDDYYIDDVNFVRRSITSNKDYWNVRKSYKKIIASSDTSLKLPIIPLSYLKSFEGRTDEILLEIDDSGIVTTIGNEIFISNVPPRKEIFTYDEVKALLEAGMDLAATSRLDTMSYIKSRNAWIENNLTI